MLRLIDSRRSAVAPADCPRAASRAAFENLEVRRLLSAGSADTSFDGDGVRTDEIDGFDFGAGVAVQSDGTIVALVNTDSGAKMVRYNTNGSLAGTPIDLTNFASAVSLAVASDGTLIVAGDDNVNSGDVRVARFDSAGGPVWSVNFDVGVTQPPLNMPTQDSAVGIAVRSGGLIVVSGNTDNDMFVAELSPGGALNPSFGINGVRVVEFLGLSSNPLDSQNRSMTLDANGSAVLAGNVSNNMTSEFAMARVTTGGMLDATFGTGGMMFVDDATDNETFNGVVEIGSDLFVAGNKGPTGVLARVSPTGSFDTGFGGDGLVEVTGAEGGALNLARDGAGKLLIVGAPGNGQFSLSRYTTAGAADTAFDESAAGANDGNGNVQTVVGNGAIAGGIAVQADGRIVLSGTSFDAFPAFTTGDLALARYVGSPPAGNVVTAALDNDGNLVITGTTNADDVRVTRISTGQLRVFSGNTVINTSTVPGLILINAGDGADDVTIATDVPNDSEIHGGGGDDLIKGGGGYDLIFGEAGHDKLKARELADILVGGAGEDTLAGGEARDLLFGGADADKIAAQDESDIILSGISSHDADPVALYAIQSEWIRTNMNSSTSVRVGYIRNGGGLNGNYRLTAVPSGSNDVTVFDDNARDTLSGGTGSDWFLANTSNGPGALDKITDLSSADFSDDLAFILAP